MIRLFVLLAVLGCSAISHAQVNNVLTTKVKKLSGQYTTLKPYVEEGKYLILSFWATWCKPCISEMDALNERYDEIQEDYNAYIIGVSVDDSRNAAKLRSFTQARGWEFPILYDANSSFKRIFNFNTIPYLVVLDPNRKVIYTSTNYTPGKEEKILASIAKHKKK